MDINLDIESLALVPQEITSSTLTTRLKGICKINRIIDHINELNHQHNQRQHEHQQHQLEHEDHQQPQNHHHEQQDEDQEVDDDDDDDDQDQPKQIDTPLLNDEQRHCHYSHQSPDIDQSHQKHYHEGHQQEDKYSVQQEAPLSPTNHTTPSPSASSASSDYPLTANSPKSIAPTNLQPKIETTPTTPSPPLTATSNDSVNIVSASQFIEVQIQKERYLNSFREWIIEKKIIEYIFGPNCHVEIIKQSHTILNFVAYSLDIEHVNVIWSASSLKHCGRQVLDLLTSLVRFMRTGPVIHLYELVKGLNIEEHSEHTLLLTSHILRYIWSHSPCINQIQLCNFQNHDDNANYNCHSTIAPINGDNIDYSFNDAQQQKQNSSKCHDRYVSQQSREHNNQENFLHDSLIQQQQEQSNNQNLDENPSISHQHHMIPSDSIVQFKEFKKTSNNLTYFTQQFSTDEQLKKLADYNLDNLCEPGKTLLWDLLQDGKIDYLSANLHIEVENVLVNLVMTFGDRNIRYEFIEACLENLSVGKSVIMSLRLVPKLMSFNTLTRNLSLPAINETHAIVLWAEQDYNMSQNFFKDLVHYYDQRQAMANDGTSYCKASSLFTHIDQIITRMSFLTFIYSKPFSPEDMKLNQQQIDQLWACLANDDNARCSDVLFQWIYQQAVGEDFHGINDELLDYILKCKLPSLDADNFRLRGLKLLEQLLWIRQDYECCHGLEHPATRLLWNIGLKATDDEVSMAAIRILNHFYIYTNHQDKSTKCGKGVNFMNYCMDQLQTSLSNLIQEDEATRVSPLLDVMQKVIVLIRTHLEIFKAHWSYYLRILQLNNEADLMSHRLNAYDIKLTMSIRLVVHAASSMDKTTIEMQAGDFVGELRAEIVKWWYSQVDRTYFEQSSQYSSNMELSPTRCDLLNEDSEDSASQQQKEFNIPNDSLNPFTEFLLANQQSIRLLSHQQEISIDWDERQINELDFKDMQVIYVLGDIKPSTTSNVEAFDEMSTEKSSELLSNNNINNNSNNNTMNDNGNNQQTNQNAHQTTNYIPKSEIPSILLLRQQYFDRLIEVDKYLGAFKSDSVDLMNRAKVLSKRVWEIIQILPTSPHYKEDIKRCGLENDEIRLKTAELSNLLSAECPQRLLYSLQTIDILKSSYDLPTWRLTFIQKGGLADIYDVFMSEKLLPNDNEDWNEWLQECLAYLLKLLFQFGTRPANNCNLTNENSSSSSSSKVNMSNNPTNQTLINHNKMIVSNNNNNINSTNNNATIVTATSSTPIAANIKRTRRNRTRLISAGEDRLPLPRLSDDLLELLENTDLIFNRLIKILESSAFCKNINDQYYYVTMSSRAMIVHHVMSFLASWCKSDNRFPRFNVTKYENLLKALILDDNDCSTRRETCNGLFKLHHASSTRSSAAAILAQAPNVSVDSINSTLHCMDTLSVGEMSAENQQQESKISSAASYPKPPNVDNVHNVSTLSTTNITNSSILTANTSSSSSATTDSSIQFNNNWTFSSDLLRCLIKFLPIAETMKPPKPIRNFISENDYIRELNAPGCKDYFWLTCRLIDSIQTLNTNKSSNSKFQLRDQNQHQNQQQNQETNLSNATTSSPCKLPETRDRPTKANLTPTRIPSTSPPSTSSSCLAATNSGNSKQTNCVNLYELCEYLIVAIRRRRTFETRDFTVEDDSLRGMLLMMVMALKRDPSFRYTTTANEFIQELYEYLFAPPNKTQRYLPKCKSPATRSTAFDLMISLVERCPKNYFKLLDLLVEAHHHSVVKNTYPSDYWPHDDCRSEFGFVGLINLGATCYLATCMQHLFMIPHLRYAVLSIEDTRDIRHGEIIRELQKIFTFMLESERKAYNPKNFCKVYSMDNHPLNIAEQTDMTEFFTDLITKLEESSLELRQIIKGLFSGTLSNNVVSLDCPHISRTSEEFYTLRVQVADMRSLNDSLDELTIKDTLEGDNMYTCSTCEKKVRAQKRACINKLPRILCFNTMRYTFNMATMTKEKVNTHFSFPPRLDMTDYLEENLMKRQQSSSSSNTKESSCRTSCSSDDQSIHMPPESTPPPPPMTTTSTTQQDDKNLGPQSIHECTGEDNTKSTCSNETGEHNNEKSIVDDGVKHSKQQTTNCDRTHKTDSPNINDNDCDQNELNSSPKSSTSNPPSSEANSFQPESESHDSDSEFTSNIYELIGVTVHTGNADGGHYYCFVRDCEDKSTDKPRWYLFNDAEVKPFDDSHIGTECFGGELTTKSYDAINDRFMDFSIEKTNSAYMLFYKRLDYKYLSKSVAQKYLESDTEGHSINVNVKTNNNIKNKNNSPNHNININNQTVEKMVVEQPPAGSVVTGKVSCSKTTDQVNFDNSKRAVSPIKMDSHRPPSKSSKGNINNNNKNARNQGISHQTINNNKQSRQHYSRNNLQQQPRQQDELLQVDFNVLCSETYENFQLPKNLANWIWADNMKFYRDKNVFEHNYFNFIWQVCAHLPKTLNNIPEPILELYQNSSFIEEASEDVVAIKTAHLAITFVLGVLMNSRERPNLSNWTELIRKQFNSSKAACDWLMQLIDDEETWLKQMLLRCPIEMVRQLFQRLCNDLTGTKQHKKLRLIR